MLKLKPKVSDSDRLWAEMEAAADWKGSTSVSMEDFSDVF